MIVTVYPFKSALFGALSLTAVLAQAQISDPVPESPGDSGITLQLESFVSIPSSNGSAPRARINHLKPMYDGQGRLAVNDLRGEFYTITNGVVSKYADFNDTFPNFKESPGLGTGFTSFAFHPEFASNGIFYTAHSENPGSGTADFLSPVANAPVALQGVITEWVATVPTAETFVGTRNELMRIDITNTIHGMQEIAFNPNSSPGDPDYGKLYICIGDGGSTIRGYPQNTHRLDSVLGTILRIDPMGTNSPNGKYGIPEDNPWAIDGDPDTYDEIWAYGFRNPHRISWDVRGDGKLLSGDIGEKNIEEINLIEPGRDYGWNVREGTFVINANWENNPSAGENDEVFALPANDDTLGFTYPVVQFDHDVGVAVVGGFVYRGTLAEPLYGKYIFGDIKGGEVYVADANELALGAQSDFEKVQLELGGSLVRLIQLGGSSRADLRFGYDEDNELYLLEKSRGRIYKIVGASGPSGGGGTLPTQGWQRLVSFEDGNLEAWDVGLVSDDPPQTPGGAAIVGDPFGGDQGMVLEMTPGVAGSSSYFINASLPLSESATIRDPFPENTQATLYLKVALPLVEGSPGQVISSWGIASSLSRPFDGDPTEDFSVSGRLDVDGIMEVGDGNTYKDLTLSALDAGVFYEVWYIIDHAANTYSQYIKGGSQFPDQTLLHSDANYGYSTFSNLDSLLLSTRADPGGSGEDPIYFDDIFIDVTGVNLNSPFSGNSPFASGGKLVNISTRGTVGIDDDVLIGSLIISEDSQQVLVQAVGQELAGVAGVLADPVLEIRNPATNELIASNDNWEDTQAQEITAIWDGSPPLASGSTSSALLMTLDQGSYSAVVLGKDGSTGVALVEIYEIDQ